MVTELVIDAVMFVINLLEGLIPPIPWPDWLSAPVDWMTAAAAGGAIQLNALFAYVHPITIDVTLLMLTMRAVERFVRRSRGVLTTVTGGGGA